MFPSDIQTLISSYPRQRRELSPALKAAYTQIYLASREGQSTVYGITHRLESWMHRKVAQTASPGDRILEIGAGTLNHLRWEKDYASYDAVEPFNSLYERREEINKIRNIYQSIHDIPSETGYNRIISVAVLEHVEDLPALIVKAKSLLEPGGIFCAGIPSEGGLLWGLAWRLAMSIPFRYKYKASYEELLRHEHLSTAPEIITLLKHNFTHCDIRRFPLPAYHASLYTVVICR